MWHAHARFDISELPDRRVVISFEFENRSEHYWVVVEPPGCSICDVDPGFEVDVEVTADLPTLYRVFYHQQAIGSALKEEKIRFVGQRSLVRRMPKMFELISGTELGTRPGKRRPRWRDEPRQLEARQNPISADRSTG